MMPSSPLIQQLHALADHLQASQAKVFSAWQAKVERDPALVTNAQLTRTQFIDHMPFVLTKLAEGLRHSPESAVQEAKAETTEAHSHHRWQQGYDLRNLVGEWVHLNTAVVEELEHYAQNHHEFSSEALATARRKVAEFMGGNITQGVVAYQELLQSEAATRVRELEVALAGLRDLEQRRGQLLRTSVHDLQGSLGIVTGNVDMLDHDGLTGEDREEMRTLLQQGVIDLKVMLADLMDLGRLEAGQETLKVADFDAAKLLAELSATLHPLAQERNLYLTATGPEELTVQGDVTKVRRVAQNLLLNALKYTQEGGVAVAWGEAKERWFLRVEDTGPGLQASTAAPLAKKLAEATETAHEVEPPSVHSTLTTAETAPPKLSAGGEGVGLAIVKRLCELLDAGLELESQAEGGTVFRVFFPRHYPVGLVNPQKDD
jgi:signal transduction histidine kinase